MDKNIVKKQKSQRRKIKIRAKIKGSKIRPRLSVFKSNKGMFLQLIDDNEGKTLASAHRQEIKSKGKKIEVSYELGKMIAKKAGEKGIKKAVFDRGGNKYHGRIEAVARGAREAGLEF